MSEIVPADPAARRAALMLWTVAALAGTVAVWWLSSYIEDLTALARTDREASLALFRSRVLPALAVVVIVAVSAGILLVRQGLRIVRTSRLTSSPERSSRQDASPIAPRSGQIPMCRMVPVIPSTAR